MTAARIRMIFAISYAAAAVTLLAGCSSAGSAASSSSHLGLTVYQKADRSALPDVGGSRLDGGVMQLRAAAPHQVLVINVWASWCTECRSEAPRIAAVARKLKGKNVRFVGIDEQDSAGAAKAFAQRTGMDYPQVSDPDGTVLGHLTLLPSYGIPSTLVIDTEGRMAARIIGAASVGALLSAVSAAGS